MPPSAFWNSPTFWKLAPVNAPLTCPNRMLSSKVSGIAAQLTVTYGFSVRRLFQWIARATRSLPVPLSPRIRIGALVGAASSSLRSTSCHAGDRPLIINGRPVAARDSLSTWARRSSGAATSAIDVNVRSVWTSRPRGSRADTVSTPIGLRW